MPGIQNEVRRLMTPEIVNNTSNEMGKGQKPVQWVSQVNRFEQIPMLGQQMSLAGWGRDPVQREKGKLGPGPCTWGGEEGRASALYRGPCTVRSNAPWLMVIWAPPVDRQTDIRLKTLPSRNFRLAYGNKQNSQKWNYIKSNQCWKTPIVALHLNG